MVESWNRMEWRLVAGGGGKVVWRLHQIMSVRIVFGGTCDDSKLELRGGTPGPCRAHSFLYKTEWFDNNCLAKQRDTRSLHACCRATPCTNPSVFAEKSCTNPFVFERNSCRASSFLYKTEGLNYIFYSKTRGQGCLG